MLSVRLSKNNLANCASSPVPSNFTTARRVRLGHFSGRSGFALEPAAEPRAHLGDDSKSAVSALFLVDTSSTSFVASHRNVTPIRRNHQRRMAKSMAQRSSSIPLGAPGLVTEPNAPYGEQKSGEHAQDPLQVAQPRAQTTGLHGAIL